MSTITGMRRKRSATLLRVEEDGTAVWRYQGRILRVATAQVDPGGHYPLCGRARSYRPAKDWRGTVWFAEAVRDRRQQQGAMVRAVFPGPQSWAR